MKKVFTITESNKAPARQIDGFKHEIKKYIARERRKDLPEGSDFWDFECKIGKDESVMADVHVTQINSSIDSILIDKQQSFCVEIVAIAKTRNKKS